MTHPRQRTVTSTLEAAVQDMRPWETAFREGAMEYAARSGRLAAAIQIALIDLKYDDAAGADEVLRNALAEVGVVPCEPRETRGIAA